MTVRHIYSTFSQMSTMISINSCPVPVFISCFMLFIILIWLRVYGACALQSVHSVSMETPLGNRAGGQRWSPSIATNFSPNSSHKGFRASGERRVASYLDFFWLVSIKEMTFEWEREPGDTCASKRGFLCLNETLYSSAICLQLCFEPCGPGIKYKVWMEIRIACLDLHMWKKRW